MGSFEVIGHSFVPQHRPPGDVVPGKSNEVLIDTNFQGKDCFMEFFGELDKDSLKQMVPPPPKYKSFLEYSTIYEFFSSVNTTAKELGATKTPAPIYLQISLKAEGGEAKLYGLAINRSVLFVVKTAHHGPLLVEVESNNVDKLDYVARIRAISNKEKIGAKLLDLSVIGAGLKFNKLDEHARELLDTLLDYCKKEAESDPETPSSIKMKESLKWLDSINDSRITDLLE